MRFSPAHGGAINPMLSVVVTPEAYRSHNPGLEWAYNPWTGERRREEDIASDPTGLLIAAPGAPWRPAA